MADSRKVVMSADDARAELAPERSRPSWRQSSHTLPFGELSDDEFEILCYLLLKAENPADDVIYYGRTRDLGRDVIHRLPDGTLSLIQCKRYSNNVGIGEIRHELAKLFANIFEKKIPEVPSEVCFYVVPDLTGPAKDLVLNQSQWKDEAEKSLFDFLGTRPSAELVEFAKSLWPLVPPEHNISLTHRCKLQPDILDEFFRVRHVIDASLPEIDEAIRRHTDPIRNTVASLLTSISSPATDIEPIGKDTITSAFRLASRDLFNWPTTLGNETWIDRPELETLTSKISSTDSSTTILLGVRGSGKSALLAKVGDDLSKAGMPVLAIKADFVDRSVDSIAKLSEYLRLPALLTHCVDELSDDNVVILLVDQLDALGDLVDLHSGRLNVLLDAINQLSGKKHIHIVASCREFEFRHDVRLSSIEADEIALELPTWSTVAEILRAESGIDATEWPEEIRESLRAPQHLKMLLRNMRGLTEHEVARSYQQLLDDLWEQYVTNPNGPVGRSELLMEMATIMGDQEVLWLPFARFDNRIALVETLEAADIIHRPPRNSTVGFRHQTLFEHALARAFARGDARLAPYVLARQDAIFIRPALWSTLRYLREVSPPQYSRELCELTGTTLRLHITYLLIEFLGQISNPTVEEEQIVFGWLSHGRCRSRILLSMAGNPGWFAFLERTQLAALMQTDLKDLWPVAVLLKSAWPFARENCLSLLRIHWLPHSDRDELTASVFRDLEQWDELAIEDICTIVGRTDLNDFAVMDIAQAISANSPELAPKVIATKLNKNLRAVQALPEIESPPLPEGASLVDMMRHERQYERRARFAELFRRSDGHYELPALAEAAPAAFVKEIWPWFIAVIGEILELPHHIIYSFREYHGLLFDLDRDSIRENELISSIDDSVKQFARIDVDEFCAFVREWKYYDAKIVQRILCRGLKEIADRVPIVALDFLVEDRRRLALGGHEDNFSDSRDLIRTLSEHLDQRQLMQLENAVLTWSEYVDHIEDEDAETRTLRKMWDREKRLRLLTTLPFSHLSTATQSLVRSEELAIPEYRDYDHEPIREMIRVDSPMSSDQMSKAKDEHVLKLFDELVDRTEAGHPRDFLRGGTVQASQELARLAETEPQRVSTILRKLRPNDQQTPAAFAIRALGDNLEFNEGELFELVKHLDTAGFHSPDYRGEAAHACFTRANKGQGLPNDVCQLLEKWLNEWAAFSYYRNDESKDAFEKADDTPRNILWSQRGIVLPHGSYWLLLALTYGYIRRDPPENEKWLAVLENHIEAPESTYTWKTLTDELRFLRRCDSGRAIAFVRRLFEKFPRVRDSQSGAIFLAQNRSLFESDIYRKHLSSIRDSEWKFGKQAYGELVGISYLFDEFSEWSQTDVDKWAEDKSVAVGLAYAIANTEWNDNSVRQRSIALFERLGSTADGDVAEALMSIFVTDQSLQVSSESKKLLEVVVKNPKLIQKAPDHWFVQRLQDVVTYYPELVCDICNLVVDHFANQLCNIAFRASLSSSDLVDISMTLQRLSNFRDKGLTLFERLLELGVYDAAALLQSLDRRPVNVRNRTPRRRRRKR